MISTVFGFGNSSGADKLNAKYLGMSKDSMYSLAFTLFIAVVILIPVFLCVIPCVPGFRNWEHKPSSQVSDDALQQVVDGEEPVGVSVQQDRSEGSMPLGGRDANGGDIMAKSR